MTCTTWHDIHPSTGSWHVSGGRSESKYTTCGVVWCGVVGVVWCGRCGVVWCGLFLPQTTNSLDGNRGWDSPSTYHTSWHFMALHGTSHHTSHAQCHCCMWLSVCFWFVFGLVLVWFWFSFGLVLFWFGFGFGFGPVLVWFGCGFGLVLVWLHHTFGWGPSKRHTSAPEDTLPRHQII